MKFTWRCQSAVRAVLSLEADSFAERLLDLLSDEENEFDGSRLSTRQTSEFYMLANSMVAIAALDTEALNSYGDVVASFLTTRDDGLPSVTAGHLNATDAQLVAEARFREYYSLLVGPLRTNEPGFHPRNVLSAFALHAAFVPGIAGRATSAGTATFLTRTFGQACARFRNIDAELVKLEERARGWLAERSALPGGHTLGYGPFQIGDMHVSPRLSRWDPEYLDEPLRSVVQAIEHQYPSNIRNADSPSMPDQHFTPASQPLPTVTDQPATAKALNPVSATAATSKVYLLRGTHTMSIDSALLSMLLLMASTSGWHGGRSLVRDGRLRIQSNAILDSEEARQLGVVLGLAAVKQSATRSPNDPLVAKIREFMDFCAGGEFAIQLLAGDA